MRPFYGRIVFFGVVMYMFLIKESFAYLDPGTGSYVLQIIAAAIFGGFFAFKSFWAKILSFFKQSKNDPPNNAE